MKQRIFALLLTVVLMTTLISVGVTPASAAQNLAFSRAFGDYMVLQQNKPISIFGTGTADTTVTVTITRDSDGQAITGTATVDYYGQWRATLDPIVGSMESYTVTVTDGTESDELNNVVFGEVWVAAGQSNMEWTMAKADEAAEWKNKEYDGHIRFFNQSTGGSRVPYAQPNGVWYPGEDWMFVQNCSAIAYYFAEQLYQELQVPVGIINTAKGGTRFCTWLSQETFDANPEFTKYVTEEQPVPANDGTWDTWSAFYNSRIAPFEGFQTAGILWYQGESDVERGGQELLEDGIPLLVEEWSRIFNPADDTLLPFISFQLAAFSYPSKYLEGTQYTHGITGNALPLGNEYMNKGVEAVNAKSGTAISIPFYDVEAKLNDYHPTKKFPPAKRAADAALGLVYDRKELFSGPRPVAANITGTTVTVLFENVGTGLTTLEGKKLSGFYVPDASQATGYKLVEATISGKDTVTFTVPSADITEIAYAFVTMNMTANLCNSEGYLPLAFRMAVSTDPLPTTVPTTVPTAPSAPANADGGVDVLLIVAIALGVLAIGVVAVVVAMLTSGKKKA